MSKSQQKPANGAAAPEAAAEWAPLESLKGWPKNPRKNAATVGKVAALIKRYGWGRPLGARRQNGELIWGHTTAAAAWSLIRAWAKTAEHDRAKWHADARRTATTKQVPVRFRDDLSETEAHDLALADNRAQEFSEWDEAVLAEELGQRSLGTASLLGWSGDDLADVLKVGDDEALPGDDEGAAQLGSGLTYQIVIVCDDEKHQGELLERLEGEGLSAKPLVT